MDLARLGRIRGSRRHSRRVYPCAANGERRTAGSPSADEACLTSTRLAGVDCTTAARTAVKLRRTLGAIFPAAADARIDYAWSGVLDVPRDWCVTVQYDAATGAGLAGGYADHGVTAYLAGRTLADPMLGLDPELTRLPWAGLEYRPGAGTSRIARLADHVSGA